MPEQRNAGWRGRGKDKSSAARHRWQESTGDDDGYQAKKLWYRTKIGLLASIAALLIGVFVWALFFLEPWPGLVAIAVTRYDAPIPPNAQAKEDYDQILSLDQQVLRAKGLYDAWNTADKDVISPDQAKKLLSDQLSQYWRTRRSWFRQSREVVVIYVSMHGVVNGKGEPCLLLPHAPALDSRAWWPVSDVLQTIHGSVPAPVKKLLVLDSTRIAADWQMGLLYNSFADGLQAAVDGANVPNLVVLNATSAGEVGWSSPEASYGSVFGHYFRLGLAGAADGPGSKAKDGVTLDELASYLQKEVKQWVAENRADAQTPQVIKPSNQQVPNFLLAKAAPGLLDRILSGKSKAATGSDDAREDRPGAASTQEVGLLWVKHQELRGRPAYRTSPLKWQAFEQKLLRLEELSLAGSAYQGDYQAALKAARDLADELDRASFTALPALSLPLALNYRAKPPEYLAVVDEEWKKFQAQGTAPALDAALRKIDDFGLIPEDLKPGPVELHFMRMLRRHLDSGWRTAGSPLARAVGNAARVRALAEDAAAPTDERAQYWIKQGVDDADSNRRDAEDQLFVGNDSKSWGDAERKLVKAAGDAKKVAEALAVRDRAWAELPYWGEWLTRRPRPGTADKAGDSKAAVELQSLIRAARALSDELVRPDSDRADATALVDASRELGRNLEQSASELQRQCASLLDPNRRDAANLRDISDVLATPLVSGELRNRLRSVFADLVRSPSKGESVGQTDQAKAGRGHLDRLQEWNEHPALAILQQKAPPSSSTVDAASFARSGELVREWLGQAIPDEVKKGLNKELPNRQLTEVADSLSRRAAVIRSEWSDLSEEPAQLLRKYDLHALMTWQCRRTLDDFWGPAPNETRPYFVQATDKYLAAAQALLPTKMPELETLKLQRVSAAKGSFAPSAKRIDSKDDPDGFTITTKSLTVLDDEDDDEYAHSVAIAQHSNLPLGSAAYFVRGRSGDSVSETIPMETARQGNPIRRSTIAVPAAGSSSAPLTLNYFVSRRDLQQSGELLQAVVLYRGHEFSRDIRYLPDRGTVVSHVRPEYADPSVIVRGPEERGTVMFIFDCSYSMIEKTDVPNLAGTGSTQHVRMDLAKTAFRQTLAKLAESGRYRVGVILYGHRMSSDKRVNPEYQRIILEKRIGQPINTGLQPGEDTEMLLPIVPFKNMEDPAVTRLSGHLDAVRPWGITPLYPAVIQAAKELRAAPGPNKRIVVITDGKDNQGRDAGVKTAKDVKDACKGIPIYFVGFDMARDEVDVATKEFEGIVKECGGAFLNANNPKKLMASLEQSLDLRRYRVRFNDEEVDKAEIDQPLKVPRRAQTEYVVEVVAAVSDDNLQTPKMRLEGGEFIQIRMDDRRLEFDGCLEDGLVRREMREPQAPGEKFNARVLRPETSDNAVTFPICLENVDPAKFSPRPAEIWVNIKPVMGDGATAPTYTFYDRSFEQGMPVPMMRFRAADWPDAPSAKIEMWCNMRRKTSPEKGKSLLVSQFGDNRSQVLQFPGMDKVEIEVEIRPPQKDNLLRVSVTEIHPELAASLNPLRVEIDSAPTATCKRAVHRYSEKYKIAKHTFYFDDVRDTNDVKNFRLLFMPHAAVKEEATYSGEIPVKVR
jgi:hypothetical protein